MAESSSLSLPKTSQQVAPPSPVGKKGGRKFGDLFSNKQKKLAEHLKPIRDELKKLHQDAYVTDHKSEVESKTLAAWNPQTTAVAVLTFRKLIEDRIAKQMLLYESETTSEAKNKLNPTLTLLKNGQPLAMFKEDLFQVEDPDVKITWNQFKTSFWKPYLDKTIHNIDLLKKEKEVVVKIEQVFEKLEKKKAKSKDKKDVPINYRELQDKLKAAHIFPEDHKFWKLECWQPDFSERPVSQHLFLETYYDGENSASIQKLIEEYYDDVRLPKEEVDLFFTGSKTVGRSRSAIDANIPPPIGVLSQSSVYGGSAQRSRTFNSVSGRRKSRAMSITAESRIGVEDTQQQQDPLATIQTEVSNAVLTEAAETLKTQIEIFFNQIAKEGQQLLTELAHTIIGKAREGLAAAQEVVTEQSQLIINCIKEIETQFKLHLDALFVQADQLNSKIQDAEKRLAKAKDKNKPPIQQELNDLEKALEAVNAKREALDSDHKKVVQLINTHYREYVLQLRAKEEAVQSQSQSEDSKKSRLGKALDIVDRELSRCVGDPKSTLFTRHFKPLQPLSRPVVPHFADLSSELPPVQDQGHELPGYLYALLAVKQWQEFRNSGTLETFSLQYLLDNLPEEGPYGPCLEDALKTLEEHGIVTERLYQETQEGGRSSQTSVSSQTGLRLEGLKYKIDGYLRIQDIDSLKTAIHRFGPIPLSLPVYNLNKLRFWVPENDSEDSRKQVQGYHTVLITGYNDETQNVLLRNSFGSRWGSRGHVRMPYKEVFDRYHVAIACLDGVPTQSTEATPLRVSVKDILRTTITELISESPEQRTIRKLRQEKAALKKQIESLNQERLADVKPKTVPPDS